MRLKSSIEIVDEGAELVADAGGAPVALLRAPAAPDVAGFAPPAGFAGVVIPVGSGRVSNSEATIFESTRAIRCR